MTHGYTWDRMEWDDIEPDIPERVLVNQYHNHPGPKVDLYVGMERSTVHELLSRSPDPTIRAVWLEVETRVEPSDLIGPFPDALQHAFPNLDLLLWQQCWHEDDDFSEGLLQFLHHAWVRHVNHISVDHCQPTRHLTHEAVSCTLPWRGKRTIHSTTNNHQLHSLGMHVDTLDVSSSPEGEPVVKCDACKAFDA